MHLLKRKITEQEAASAFVVSKVKAVGDAWPAIVQSLNNMFHTPGQPPAWACYGEKFVLQDEDMAKLHLFGAAVAADLQAVRNLFPQDQALRIRLRVLGFVHARFGELAVQEIQGYCYEAEMAIENTEGGTGPAGAIPGRLLCRWLGEGIRNFESEIEINGRKTREINPLVMMVASAILSDFTGTWKRIKDEFKLVEGDVPPDFDRPDTQPNQS